MRKILVFMVIAVVCSGASAQLKLSEQFVNPPFSANGDLGTQNSWVQFGTGTDVQVIYRTNNTGALTYSGYTSGETSVLIDRYTSGGSGIDPYKTFNVAIPTNVDGVLFASFVINVSAARNTGDYCIAFRTSGGNYQGRLFIRNSGGNVQFGIETDGASPDWTGNFSYNTTYLIVIRYDIINGTNNDDVYLWVNPSLLSEPATGIADASVSNTGDNNGAQTISGLAIRQAGNNAPTAQLDAFRVALGTGQSNTTANASAAWTNLNPEGAPLPVKLSGINAYEKQSGIQINWTAYQEENLSMYQIERSADGRSFIAIGDEAPRNLATATKYGFFDVNPAPGINYYRIRSVDADGKANYSSVLRVSRDKSDKNILLYPNPVSNGFVSVQGTDLVIGNYKIGILNAAGQQVYTKQFSHNGGAVNQTVQLPAGLNTGMYLLQLDKEDIRVLSKFFMIQ